MFQSLTIKIVIGVILGWLKSLWERFQLINKAKEEGRKEVKDALDQKKLEADKEIEVIRNTDTSFDTAIDELRKRAGSSTDVLRSNKTSTSGGSE